MSSELLTIPSNLTISFFDHSLNHPEKLALVEPLVWDSESDLIERKWSYREFSQLVSTYIEALKKDDIQPEHQVLILLPVSAKMYALVAACFATGAIPVFVDSTLSQTHFLKALNQSRPKIIFSTNKLFKFRPFLFKMWFAKCYTIGEESHWATDWEFNLPLKPSFPTLADIAPEQLSLVTFTSGSTGTPKAADRNHRITFCQRSISQGIWQGHKEKEMTGFPLVVLNNLAAGGETILPALVRTKDRKGVYRAVVRQIKKHCVENLVGSPDFFHSICRHLLDNDEKIDSVKNIVTGGAPVPNWLIAQIQDRFPSSGGFVVYGSTEAEPISFAAFSEVLAEDPQGYLVGKPIPDIQVKVVSLLPELPQTGLELKELTANQVGEILISGPHVIQKYLFNHTDNSKTKIKDSEGRTWHRTGDLGRLDAKGRLWIVGREKFRLQRFDKNPLDPFPIEHKMENLFAARACLRSSKAKGLQLIVARSENMTSLEMDEIQRILETHQLTSCSIYRTETLPVDSRHFWRIQRDEIKEKDLIIQS